jgi:cytochrome c-type biogenesis protein
MPTITFLVALGAGVLSFFSPCILPLVPVYLANISGAWVLTPNVSPRRHVLLHTVCFIAGFSLIFTALGASLGLLGAAVPQEVLEKVAGVLLIVFGIFLVAATKVPWLNFESRLDFGRAKGTGYLRSLVLGVIFSLGWTPCIGPILSSILALAASSQTAWQGVYLLLAYCLGLGLPFIAAGLALETVTRYFRWLRYVRRWFSRHGFVTSIIAAVLLVSVGVLMLTGYLEYLSGFVPGGY